MQSELKPLEVVSVVSMNGGEALVLNRPLSLEYERVGNDYIGSDGPFRDFLYYERGGGRFVAFAGRELTLTMKGGTIQKIKDHWWSGSMKGCAYVAVSDVKSLKECYVFSGAHVSIEDLAAMRATYTGCVYPYREYEKIIKFDDIRTKLLDRLTHKENSCRSLVSAIKSKHRALMDARTDLSASAPAAGSVPDAVLRAVKRMSQPLDASRLSGATAMADANDMNIIAAFINSLTEPAAGSGPSDAEIMAVAKITVPSFAEWPSSCIAFARALLAQHGALEGEPVYLAHLRNGSTTWLRFAKVKWDALPSVWNRYVAYAAPQPTPGAETEGE